jgi:putative endonuclease
MAPVARALAGRRTLGRLGEDVACRFLIRRGLEVVERNVAVGRGEIDVVARHGGTTVAVEVRSRWLEDPLDAFHDRKHRQVASLALALDPPCGRVDLVAVRFHPGGVDLRWVPGVG